MGRGGGNKREHLHSAEGVLGYYTIMGRGGGGVGIRESIYILQKRCLVISGVEAFSTC